VVKKTKMTQTTGNGKATLARLEQKLIDYINHNDEKIEMVRESYDSLNEKLDNITTILTSGDGKIRETRQMINDHCREHHRDENKMFKTYGLVIAACAVIATLVSIAVKMA
jgi:hypothetical protein